MVTFVDAEWGIDKDWGGAVAARMAVATSRGTAGMALAPMAITKDLKWHTKNMTL